MSPVVVFQSEITHSGYKYIMRVVDKRSVIPEGPTVNHTYVYERLDGKDAMGVDRWIQAHAEYASMVNQLLIKQQLDQLSLEAK